MGTAFWTDKQVFLKFNPVEHLLTVITLGPDTFRNIGSFGFRIDISLGLAVAA